MDIFNRILEEHERQRDLTKKILDANGDSQQRQELFERLAIEFLSHAAAEEHAFYAPMLKVAETTDQSRHSVAEHHEAIELIEKLQKSDISSSEWLTTFKQLAEDNEHHMQEEEKDVFDLVKREMTQGAIDSMLETFDTRKLTEVAELSKS